MRCALDFRVQARPLSCSLPRPPWNNRRVPEYAAESCINRTAGDFRPLPCLSGAPRPGAGRAAGPGTELRKSSPGENRARARLGGQRPTPARTTGPNRACSGKRLAHHAPLQNKRPAPPPPHPQGPSPDVGTAGAHDPRAATQPRAPALLLPSLGDGEGGPLVCLVMGWGCGAQRRSALSRASVGCPSGLSERSAFGRRGGPELDSPRGRLPELGSRPAVRSTHQLEQGL